MGWRLRKSIRIAPGVRVNLSSGGVSTTLGGRGFSVNTGSRGTFLNAGIPGTGLHNRQRIGGGSGGATQAPPSTEAAGCASFGCLGFILLVIIGMCSGASDPPSSPYTPASAALATVQREPYDAYQTRDWFYLHSDMNVRTQPTVNSTRIRTIPRGTRVQLGPKDANGWARLYTNGDADGYLYRASDHVRTAAPGARSTALGTRAGSGGETTRRARSNNGYHLGPRGGCYTYSASGRKRYVDRSYCH